MFGGLYALLGLGLNLQWSHTGVVNLGFVAFFAIGAYGSALLTLHGLPLVFGPMIGLGLAAIAAYPIGVITLRLRDDYLSIVTFGFAQVVQVLIINSHWTRGADGLTGIKQWFDGVSAGSQPFAQLALVAAIVFASLYMCHRLTESPYGRLLRAIRDNMDAVATLGKNPQTYRLVTFVIGSGLAGLAGSLYAHYIGYISPGQFDSTLSFLIFTAIIIGGSSHWGAALGTVVYVSLMESSRFVNDFGLPITAAQFAQVRLLIVGVSLLLLLRFRPQGLWPYRHRARTATDRTHDRNRDDTRLVPGSRAADVAGRLASSDETR